MEQMQNKFSQKCETHLIQYSFINISDSNLMCSKCVQEDFPNIQELIAIEDIINYKQDNVIFNWPPLNVVKYIHRLSNFKKNEMENLKKQIFEYFDQLLKNITEAVNECQKKTISELDNSEEQIEQMVKIYQQKSYLDKLNEKQDLNCFKNIILEWNKNKDETIQDFLNEMNRFLKIKWQIDQEFSEQIKEQILYQIKNIDLLSCVSNKIQKSEAKNNNFVESRKQLFEFQKQLNQELIKQQKYQFNLFKNLQEQYQCSQQNIMFKDIYGISDQLNIRQNKQKQLRFIGKQYEQFQESFTTNQLNLNNETYLKFNFSQTFLAVSDFTLDKESNYIIRIKFIAKEKENISFHIGCIPESLMEQYQESLSHITFSTNSEENIEVLKGDFLVLSSLRQHIEINLNISEKYYTVSDYPNYQNINKIKQFVDQIDKYRFGIQVSNDIECIVITDCFTVDRFQN